MTDKLYDAEKDDTNGNKLVISKQKNEEKKSMKKEKKSGKKSGSKKARRVRIKDPKTIPIKMKVDRRPRTRLVAQVNQMPYDDWNINQPNSNQLKRYETFMARKFGPDIENMLIAARMDAASKFRARAELAPPTATTIGRDPTADLIKLLTSAKKEEPKKEEPKETVTPGNSIELTEGQADKISALSNSLAEKLGVEDEDLEMNLSVALEKEVLRKTPFAGFNRKLFIAGLERSTKQMDANALETYLKGLGVNLPTTEPELSGSGNNNILDAPQWAVPYWPVVQQAPTPKTAQMGQNLYSGSQMPLIEQMVTGGRFIAPPEIGGDLPAMGLLRRTGNTLSSAMRLAKKMKGGVRIHGNYCGPSWTAGMPKAAADVTDEEFNAVPPTDDLDAACKEHDYRCGHVSGPIFGDCSQEDDQRLINAAMMVAKSKQYPAKLRAKALAVASAIKIAQKTLHRKNVTEGEGSVKWIQKMNMKKGAFTRQAKQHGMDVPEFADYVLKHKSKFDDTTHKRAVLSKTLAKIRKGSGLSFEDVLKFVGKHALNLGKSYMKSLEKPMTEREKRRYGARPGLFD